MKRANIFSYCAAGLCLALLTGMAKADESELKLSLPPDMSHAKDLQSYMLASNDTGSSTAKMNTASIKAGSEFKQSWLTRNKVHEYLGLGTIVSALATALTAPDGECKANCTNQQAQTSGTHQSLGRATRTLALSTVASGLISHWDDMHLLDDGLRDPDTQHWLLGGAGALILANAVGKAPAQGHSGQAELGAAMMIVAVKLAW